MKKCPYCAEEIQDEAIVCKHCGRDFRMVQRPPQKAPIDEGKKTTNLMIFAIVAVVLMCLCGVGMAVISPKSASVSGTQASNPGLFNKEVIYELTGSAKGVSVTLENADGGTEQGEFSLPFKKVFRMKLGSFVYLSAQKKGESGDLTCTIYLDGKKYKTATSTGAYSIASCNGLVE